MLALLTERAAAQPDVVLDVDFAMVHMGLGDQELALDHLGRAVEKRMGSMVLLGGFAPWADLREHPRFVALLQQIGFPYDRVGN